MRKPGEHARLYYDGFQTVEEGDYIRTPTGRTYLVTFARVQTAGKHAGRQHLVTIVMDPDHVPEPDAKIHPLHWYTRGKS